LLYPPIGIARSFRQVWRFSDIVMRRAEAPTVASENR
jgi:hypothetical protein